MTITVGELMAAQDAAWDAALAESRGTVMGVAPPGAKTAVEMIPKLGVSTVEGANYVLRKCVKAGTLETGMARAPSGRIMRYFWPAKVKGK